MADHSDTIAEGIGKSDFTPQTILKHYGAAVQRGLDIV